MSKKTLEALLEAAVLIHEMEGTYAVMPTVIRDGDGYVVQASLRSWSNDQTTEYDDRFELSSRMSDDQVADALEHLQSVHADYVGWRAESDRKGKLRESALSKLTTEERAELGV